MMTGAASITVPAAIGAPAKTPRPFSGSLRIARRLFGTGPFGTGRGLSVARPAACRRAADAATGEPRNSARDQARSRGRSPAPTGAADAVAPAVEVAEPGGVTWAGGAAAVSSSGSFMPD